MVHGPNGASQRVDSRADCAEALAAGWCLTPVLSAEQKAAVYAAQLAAGELAVGEQLSAGAQAIADWVDARGPVDEYPLSITSEAVERVDPAAIIAHRKRGRPRKG